jgi:hypothetical protein
VAPRPGISAKQAREADDAYLEGARQLDHKDLAAAERSFARAVQLNPTNRDYALALLVVREHRITELVQLAAAARRTGNTVRSDELLNEARKLDPDNAVIAQHFSPAADAAPPAATFSELKLPGNAIGATLGGPVELTPDPGVRTFTLTGSPQAVLSQMYAAFGIKATFDPSVNGPTATLELKDVDFASATRVAFAMTHTFAVAIQPKTVLLARDNAENRYSLEPMVEETVYFPGLAAEQMTDLANVARNIFDIKQVTASATGGDILLRGTAPTLRLLNATYADMLDGGSDVLFDVKLYEISKTHTRNIGATLPSSVGAYSVAAEAQSVVSQNQTLLNQIIAAGGIKLTGNYFQDLATEFGALIAAGVSVPQYTNLLGTVGTFGGIPLAGVFLSSGATFNFALNSTDVRTLDDVQLRSGNRQPANFRAGTRYPVITATYTSGVSSSLSSQLAGLNINGTTASSLLSQYLGTSTTNIPQFQFEDLGLTLKMTPQIKHGGDVQLALEMKLEALAGSTINSIPVLNNRTLNSTITVPAGQTAMLATLITNSETHSIDGLPFLSELPGFQGTDKDGEKDSDELLITITPHIVRSTPMRIASRPLLLPHTTATAQ